MKRRWRSSPPGEVPIPGTPTAFHHSAQGCRSRAAAEATLGSRSKMSMNPNGVPSVRTTRDFAGGMQPRWGCFDLLAGSQGSSFLAPLGQRPRKDEEKDRGLKARSMHGTDTVSDGTGFQPFVFSMSATQGVALGWYVAGPLALSIALWPYASPFGPGHRPLALGIAALSKTPSAPHAACCLISSRSFSLDEIV